VLKLRLLLFFVYYFRYDVYRNGQMENKRCYVDGDNSASRSDRKVNKVCEFDRIPLSFELCRWILVSMELLPLSKRLKISTFACLSLFNTLYVESLLGKSKTIGK